MVIEINHPVTPPPEARPKQAFSSLFAEFVQRYQALHHTNEKMSPSLPPFKKIKYLLQKSIEDLSGTYLSSLSALSWQLA